MKNVTMYTYIRLLIAQFFIIPSCLCYSPSYVTNFGKWAGRVGDQLFAYCKAKGVAHTHNMLFLYTPTPLLDIFELHQTERRCGTTQIKAKQEAHPKDERSIHINSGTLYNVDCYFKFNSWQDGSDILQWKNLIHDATFIKKLQSKIRINNFIPKVILPPDRISVAVHIRKGSGIDFDYHPSRKKSIEIARDSYALKMPQNQYYIEQIIRISEMFHDAPLYIHIFTDHTNPRKIVQKYEKVINKANIKFGCKEQGNSPDNYSAAADLCEMLRFDCLIRTMSNLSQIAHLIGNYKVVVYPIHYIKKDGRIIVDDVGVITKE